MLQTAHARRARLGIAAALIGFALAPLGAAGGSKPGNLTVFGGGGHLSILGSNEVERFVLTQDGMPPGGFTIQPLSSIKINGVFGPLQVFGVFGNITIDLKGETDEVQLDSTNIGGGLRIEFGSGDDDMVIAGASVAESVRIDLGPGGDSFESANLTAGQQVRVLGGGGEDVAFLAGPATIGGRLHVDLGDGENSLAVTTHDGLVDIADELFYSGGGGVDSVLVDDGVHVGTNVEILLDVGENDAVFQGDCDGSLLVVGGSGEDEVEIGDAFDRGIQSTIGGALELLLDAGENTADVIDVTVSGDAYVNAPNGEPHEDEISFTNVAVAGVLEIQLGKGTNEAQVLQCPSLGSLLIKAKGGSDLVTVAGSNVLAAAKVKLANGANTVGFTASTVGAKLTITTGSGNDSIDVTGTTATDGIEIDPGGGTNTVVP